MSPIIDSGSLAEEDVAEGIAHREAILDAVAFAAELFLRGDPLDTALPQVLRRIGLASGARRAALIERVAAADGSFMRPRAEWDATGVRPLLVPPDPRGYRYFPRWASELEAGHLVAGSIHTFPRDERLLLEGDGVGSIVVTPVVVNGRWWGHVGCDDDRLDRVWSSPEIDALRAAAGIIGSAIQQAESALAIDRRNAILGAVADAAPLLLATAGWVAVLPELLRSLRVATNARSAWAYEGDLTVSARLVAEEVAAGEASSTSFGLEVEVSPAAEARLARGEVIQNELVTTRPADEAAAYAELGVRSWVVVPIGASGRVWGAVGLDSREERSWTEGEIVALRVASAAIAATVERERAELRLRELQKMDAVARVAGGLAHDFGNLLAVVNGYAEFLRQDATTEHQRADAQAVLDAARRGADLVRDLLTFSRKRVGEIEAVDLNDRIRRVERMLRGVIGPRITISLDASRSIPRVWADPGELEQVIVNLVVNARDAMPAGGRITIETASAAQSAEPDVMLTVTDTGNGMDEATRARAFEPFFTTKPEGAGTGLGLATAYGAITAWGGTIDVWSELGTGTAVTIRLRPAVEP